MKILYCGDSHEGGPANYLLAILNYNKAEVTHIPPGVKLKPSVLRQRFDAIILSDYGRDCLPEKSEEKIVYQVLSGTGLLMVGGWGSFSGPFGGWSGSEIEKLLPVNCLKKDDRHNLGSGLYVFKKKDHAIIKGCNLKHAPVIIGFNEIQPKKNTDVVLTVKAFHPAKRKFDRKEYPLLVVNKHAEIRTAAFATDFAPHWCGGLVDWGTKRCKLLVTKNIQVEIGDEYVRFVSRILNWVASNKIKK